MLCGDDLWVERTPDRDPRCFLTYAKWPVAYAAFSQMRDEHAIRCLYSTADYERWVLAGE
jgi:hypothetical protein